MPTYVVERHLPGFTSEQLPGAAGAAKQATDRMSQEGVPIRYLRSTFVPGDEKCFCLYDAPTAQAVEEANRRAALPFERIQEATPISAEDVG